MLSLANRLRWWGFSSGSSALFAAGVPELGGPTSILLPCVITAVNIAILVLRRDQVEHKHFRTPNAPRSQDGILRLPCLAMDGKGPIQYLIGLSSFSGSQSLSS